MFDKGIKYLPGLFRRPIQILCFGGLLLLLAGCARKTDTIVVKIGLIDPPGHLDTLSVERYAALVNERSGGRLRVEVYPASQLGFAMDLLQGMKLGTIEMFVGATTWLGAFERDFWMSGVLYVFDDQEQARRLHEGPVFQGLAETLREKHGIRLLAQNWDRGARNFISRKPLRTIQDLNGLKVRVPEQKSWISNFKLVGANPTPIALAETFTGLQQGIVDATEQASNWLYFNKYHTVANHLVLSHHNFEETGVMIAERFFRTLPPDLQDLLTTTALELSAWHNERLLKEIAESEEQMRAAGVQIIEVDREQWREHFRTIIPRLVEEVGYSNNLTDHIMREWQ